MRTLEQTPENQKSGDQKESGLSSMDVMPIIVTARPSLSEAENALMRRLPASYTERTVRDVLSYIMGSAVADTEASTMKSLRNELGAAGSYILVNGKEAKLTDRVEGYLVDRTETVEGRPIKYRQLEIEISAVQQGGYQRRF
ncbi:MAG: hypothetical protein Q8Q31_00430 [Nanoarchaeota archaeon]|nr:hypothetical protein [Nanoarchaeota archaeon]